MDLKNVEKASSCHNVGSGSKPPGMDGRAALTGPQIGLRARPHFNPSKDDIGYHLSWIYREPYK